MDRLLKKERKLEQALRFETRAKHDGYGDAVGGAVVICETEAWEGVAHT